MKYRVLALPDHRVLSLAALKKVDQLVRNGATVLGYKPLKSVSLMGGDKGKAEFKTLADQLWGEGEKEKTFVETFKGYGVVFKDKLYIIFICFGL